LQAVTALADTLIARLDRLAHGSWPAAEIRDLDGWRLRCTGGVTRRANSVWPSSMSGTTTIDARIRAAEAFYRERGQPAIFQLSPLSQPAELDAELAARGYAVDAPTSLQLADARAAALAAEGSTSVRIEPRLFEEWFEISGNRGRFVGSQGVYRALLERIGDRALYALAYDGQEPAAVGLLVIDGEWAGISSMLTLAAHRRRGLAKALITQMAQHALARGVEHLYLPVELDNRRARALYAACGFKERYRYHYRFMPRDETA
jgi:GNAT superfamily N-acetyltransferase